MGGVLCVLCGATGTQAHQHTIQYWWRHCEVRGSVSVFALLLTTMYISTTVYTVVQERGGACKWLVIQ